MFCLQTFKNSLTTLPMGEPDSHGLCSSELMLPLQTAMQAQLHVRQRAAKAEVLIVTSC